MSLTINIPSQIVVQTAAAWAADSTVYSNKRILVTSDVFYSGTDQPRFKFANGTDTWSNLDYVPAGGGDEYAFVKYLNNTNNALADSTQYFLGGAQTTMGNNANQAVQVELPTCTVEEAYITTYNGSVVGSNEAVQFDLVHAGGTSNISNSITWDANRSKGFSVTGLSIAVTAGLSYVLITTPAFSTNPNAARCIVILKIKLP